MTRGERKRAFQVMLYALSEERRVCGMSDEEYKRRYREAYESCYDKEYSNNHSKPH